MTETRAATSSIDVGFEFNLLGLDGMKQHYTVIKKSGPYLVVKNKESGKELVQREDQLQRSIMINMNPKPTVWN